MRRFSSSIRLISNLLLSAEALFGCFLPGAVNGPFGPFSIIGAAASRFANLRHNSERRGNTARLSRSSTSFPNLLVLVSATLAECSLVQHKQVLCWLGSWLSHLWPVR
jgi:hypothetical protein